MLLVAGEPAALTVERPQGSSELVLNCDHASQRIPQALGSLGLDAASLQTHIAWDIGAAGVARKLSAMLDATLVLQNYSRLVIDCNRPPGSRTSIPTVSEETSIAGNQGLSAAAASDRVEAIFTPYHEGLKRILDTRCNTGRRPALIAVHSFTPIYLRQSRPWQVGLMYRQGRGLGPALLQLLRQDTSLQVGDNEPYAIEDDSDYTLIMHGEARQLAHVGIEIRQDLIADEPGQQAWANRLGPLLVRAAQAVIYD
ncbi:MAG: N-formylglutamate amidohydrolase [Steroidobacteraceae bacterium]